MTTGRGSSALHLIYRQRLLSVFKTLRSALTTLPPRRKQASAGGESSLRSAKVGNGISLTDRHRAGSLPSFLFGLIGLTASMKRPQAGETSAPARARRAARVVLPRGPLSGSARRAANDGLLRSSFHRLCRPVWHLASGQILRRSSWSRQAHIL